MPTIIDSLLVTLGLETKGFKEGAEEAERAQAKLKAAAQGDAKAVGDAHAKTGASTSKLGKQRDTEAKAEEKRQALAERQAKARQQDQKKRTDATIEGLKSVGLFAAGAVIGFETLKSAVEAYGRVNGELAAAGRLAPTVGASVKELGILGDAYKQVGGSAADAAQDVASLAHAQFSIISHNPDKMAGFARTLGVSLFGPDGKQRDKLEVLKDIGAKLRGMTNDQQTQAQYAREMGLSEAAIQLYVLKQADARDKILADAAKTNQATEAGAKAAQKLEAGWSRVKNIVHGVGQAITQATNGTLGDLLNGATDFLEREHQTKGLGGGKGYGGKDAPYSSSFATAEKKYGLPAGTLAALANTESRFNPNAQAKKNGRVTGQGLMQLNPAYFPSAGKDVNADIDTAGAEFSRLYKKYRKMYPASQAFVQALRAYNYGEGNLDKATKGGKALPKETQNYAPSVVASMRANAGFAANAAAPSAGGAGAAAPGASTSVQIDSITVNTQATDAHGVAAALPGALARKGVVAQANTGLN